MHDVSRALAIAAVLVFLGVGCTTQVPQQQDEPSPSVDDAALTVAGKRLDLSRSGLTSLPPYVFERSGLEMLDVSNNALTGALPSEIGKLTGLRVLDASGNRMTGVPAEIGRLRELRVLDLSNNRLTGLPLELGQLSNLETLDLSGNDVSKQDLDAIRKNIPQANIVE